MSVLENADKVLLALFEVKKKLRPMVKDSNNPFFKSKYLELSDILSNLEPILHDEGLFLIQPTEVRDGKTIVVNKIIHAKSGQYIVSEFPADVATADPQKLGSSVSYARRYGIQALLSLNVVDDDGNAAAGKGKVDDKSAPARSSNFGSNKQSPSVPNPEAPLVASASTDTATLTSSSLTNTGLADGNSGTPARRGSFGRAQ